MKSLRTTFISFVKDESVLLNGITTAAAAAAAW